VPQSLSAKWDLGIGRMQSLGCFAAYFADLDRSWTPGIPILALLGFTVGFRPRRAARPLLAWTAAYVAAFLVTGKFVYPYWPFEWYFLPPLLLYSIAAALGAAFVWSRLVGLVRARSWIASVVVAALVVFGLADGAELVYRRKAQIHKFVDGREVLYERMARRLTNEYGVDHDVVAAWEIGALGLRYPGPILDLHGLVTLGVVGLPLADVLAERAPVWFVSWNTSIPDDVRTARWFKERYRLVAEETNWESRKLQMYRRAPAGSAATH
jgi:hypothetical protein